METFIMSMLVKNEAGVLTRVSGLFARRGFNIDSLSVGETLDKSVSRITITATGDEYVKEQIQLQLQKLHDVLIVESMPHGVTVTRELLLIKVNVAQGERSEILEAISIFRAKVVDLTPTSLTVEITGERNKCNAFLEYLRPFGIAELCRTGITAISRGSSVLTPKDE
ncbi:MAG TPA: acetolactate synthase small subunit [Eubacteriales bacterium]|jgi:acetolactate synthase-1/3 small subunit|nr:acetolactate synthase small subunit [Clostridia bacterium]HRR89456.1 acetolactate synthase small subunit [Eubacteriales bacterium]HRU84540.1 acetolactate synthase small subunit [Eubacteriales bacterium]